MSDPPPPPLPPELWIYIIRLAVPFYIISDYIPFEEQKMAWDGDVLRDKCTFALVCKSWNRAVSPMLAEDIKFARPLEPYLESLVFGSATVDPRGRLVRRLQLPYCYIPAFGLGVDSVASLLSSCPNVEYLHRHYSSAKYFIYPRYPIHHPSFANLPQLTNLTRVDWFCAAQKSDTSGSPHPPAALHSLANVVNHSPNLQYLSISGNGPPWPVSWPMVPLTHPNVQTLRVGDLPTGLDTCIAGWKFPSLHYLIVECSPIECVRVFTRQVHTIELVPRQDGSVLQFDLNDRPNIHRMNFSVLFPSQAYRWRGEYHHVREIGLDPHVSDVCWKQGERSPGVATEVQLLWLGAIELYGFIHVNLVELHGDWDRWQEKIWFINLRERLKARGAELRYLRD